MLPDDTAQRQTPVVLITRPEGQQLAFTEGCKELGFSIALLPCLQIIPSMTDPSQLHQQLACHSTALFTSANAVRLAHLVQPFPWPGQQVHAIGAATARALDQYHQPLALVPQAPYNSEAYLQQLSLELPGSLLIIKGRGGRDLIQTELHARGWQVSTIDVYERIRPEISSDHIDVVFTSCAPDIISITSDEVLGNLWHLCRHHADYLKNIPLVVNSSRCAQLAKDLGFLEEISVAIPAGDRGQLDCLAHWRKTIFDKR